MTWALCLNCGATKFGAICPCPNCQTASTGDMNLDITFSDHRYSVATLEGFGAVIASLRQVCEDDQTRFWTFIHYISTRHPDILGVNMPPEQQASYEAILAKANPPPATVEESARMKMFRDLKAVEDARLNQPPE